MDNQVVVKKMSGVNLHIMNKTKLSDTNCEVCFKIICKSCGWEPNKKEVEAIQSGVLTNCPECGWSPRVS